MGEYARIKTTGEEIKIGTCEDMYYLRFDQRHLVSKLSGNVDPNSDDVYALRFRFPWPDEDNCEPGGDFHNNAFERAFPIPGATMPDGVDHYSVQFVASAGYVTSLPCPEGPQALKNLTIHRNGFSGAVKLVQQKLLKDGRLVPVCMCGGCGARYRVEDPADIEALAVAFRAEADRRYQAGQHNGTSEADAAPYHKIADRILEGAQLGATVPA